MNFALAVELPQQLSPGSLITKRNRSRQAQKRRRYGCPRGLIVTGAALNLHGGGCLIEAHQASSHMLTTEVTLGLVKDREAPSICRSGPSESRLRAKNENDTSPQVFQDFYRSAYLTPVDLKKRRSRSCNENWQMRCRESSVVATRTKGHQAPSAAPIAMDMSNSKQLEPPVSSEQEVRANRVTSPSAESATQAAAILPLSRRRWSKSKSDYRSRGAKCQSLSGQRWSPPIGRGRRRSSRRASAYAQESASPSAASEIAEARMEACDSAATLTASVVIGSGLSQSIPPTPAGTATAGGLCDSGTSATKQTVSCACWEFLVAVNQPHFHRRLALNESPECSFPTQQRLSLDQLKVSASSSWIKTPKPLLQQTGSVISVSPSNSTAVSPDRSATSPSATSDSEVSDTTNDSLSSGKLVTLPNRRFAQPKFMRSPEASCLPPACALQWKSAASAKSPFSSLSGSLEEEGSIVKMPLLVAAA